MSSGRIARYRDYERLMARHERDLRIRRLSRLIIYVLIIVILICTFLGVYIIRTTKHHSESTPEGSNGSWRFANAFLIGSVIFLQGPF
jgi:nitrate reductase gamma subunit